MLNIMSTLDLFDDRSKSYKLEEVRINLSYSIKN